MHRSVGSLLVAEVFAAIAGLVLSGGFAPLDNALRDLRFAANPRLATGSVVFVDIDSRSLDGVGVWPWPRHVQGQMLDQLMALGADDVVFDIDFSLPSTPAEDDAFAASLKNAGGYAYLAAFRQQDSGGGPGAFNTPLAKFAAFADPVAVNVSLESDGAVRSYPLAISMADKLVPSVAALFAGNRSPSPGSFDIDFSIDPNSIDRISASDLLAGRVTTDRVAGKHVIIGASAVELRDFFVVPRYGPIPGALLQAIAGESLIQGRALRPTPDWPIFAGIALLGLIAIFGRRRIPMLLAFLVTLAVSAGAEAAAFALQEQNALLLQTGALHAAALAFAGSVLSSELVRRGEQRLRAIRERDTVRRILDRVIADNFDGVVVVNAEGRIVSASQFAETTFGRALQDHQAAEVLPEKFVALLTDALAANDRHGELTLHLGDADRVLDYVVTHSQVQLAAEPTTVACLTFRDITDRRRDEDRLRYLGTHDTLTGALTRPRLIELMAAAFENDRDVAVAIVDLRRFRIINDTLGHGQGDMLLKQVVSRLTSMGPDAIARLGGDSFALLLPGMAPEKLTGFCETVCRWLAFPYQLAGGHQAIISASAGATCSLVSGRTPETLLSHADMALSAAKQHVAGVTLFQPEMDQRLQERQAMDTALRRAMARREFTLAFQPQVNTTDGRIVGAEALARWADPTLGNISPVQFIPAAEETGLIVELGRWALNAACAEARTWPSHVHIAVNVSPVQFELSDVVADVRDVLERTGLDPRRLELEMTEGIFVRDLETVTARLDELRSLGVSIALDDFGTGYSSLSYLGRLPADKIKIDQSFVKRLPDTEAAAIINTVVALSQTLGKQVIAEGVETADQAWMLQLIGCSLVQGFHFGRPGSAGEFAAALVEAPATRVLSA